MASFAAFTSKVERINNAHFPQPTQSPYLQASVFTESLSTFATTHGQRARIAPKNEDMSVHNVINHLLLYISDCDLNQPLTILERYKMESHETSKSELPLVPRREDWCAF